jgi:hypothetical protein
MQTLTIKFLSAKKFSPKREYFLSYACRQKIAPFSEPLRKKIRLLRELSKIRVLSPMNRKKIFLFLFIFLTARATPLRDEKLEYQRENLSDKNV